MDEGSLSADDASNEGFASADTNPSPGFGPGRNPLPQRERGKHGYGTIEIGEKSMNQLFGWITPFTFGLIARGPTSCAT